MSSYSLNNFTAPDSYLAPAAVSVNGRAQVCGPATLQFLPVLDHINLDVVNGAIYFSVMQTSQIASPNSGVWQPETFMLPGSRVLQRQNTTGIRVRAAVTATNLATAAAQAQVTVEAVES